MFYNFPLNGMVSLYHVNSCFKLESYVSEKAWKITLNLLIEKNKNWSHRPGYFAASSKNETVVDECIHVLTP